MLVYAGYKNKSKEVVHAGDPVVVRHMPVDVPHHRVDDTIPPVVASIRRVGHLKYATVKYTDTEDGKTHLMELPASSLRGGRSEGRLRIGDHVVLKKRGAGVLPAVGSEGKVLGGGGDTPELYTVTFQMTNDPDDESELARTVTVTQDCVPRSALGFIREESEEELEGGGDEDDSSDSDDNIPEERVPEEGIRPSSALFTLRRELSSEVRAQVMQILSLEELEELAERLETSSVNGRDLAAVLGMLSTPC
jgi:hypothetical protein